VATALGFFTQTAECLQVDMTNTAVASTQTAMAVTPAPTATAIVSSYVNVWDTNTRASDAIIDNIISWEENKEFPYNDSTNNCTVGIGHKLHDGPCSPQELSTKYSPEQIQEWFKQDLSEAEKNVRAMFQTLDNEFRPNEPQGNPFPITQAQFDALVSFTFNAGAGRLINLIRATIQPETGTFDYEMFSHLMLTRYAQGAPGLLVRRQAEVDLFVKGIYP
jgi:GH24 family phage-related lysozyme (muramidase)